MVMEYGPIPHSDIQYMSDILMNMEYGTMEESRLNTREVPRTERIK